MPHSPSSVTAAEWSFWPGQALALGIAAGSVLRIKKEMATG
jgi:hypothetical protein